jgi:hypothetical protein
LLQGNEEAADEGGEEEDDDNNINMNNNNNQAPPPAAAAAAPARRQPAAGDVDQLARAMGRANLGRPPYVPFNFAFRFPVVFTETGPLEDGYRVVYADYFSPSLHPTRYNATVSEDGLTVTLTMQLPRVFTDVAGRAEAGEHAAHGPNAVAFIMAARETTDRIAAMYPNLDGIEIPGQQDTLPFACRQRTDITHIYHDGDELLNDQFQRDPVFALNGVGVQLYPFIRVAFVSLEAIRTGGSVVRLNNQLFRSPRGRVAENTHNQQYQHHPPPNHEQPQPAFHQFNAANMMGGGFRGGGGDGGAAQEAAATDAARQARAFAAAAAAAQQPAAHRRERNAAFVHPLNQPVPGGLVGEFARQAARANDRLRNRRQFEGDAGHGVEVEDVDDEEED